MRLSIELTGRCGHSRQTQLAGGRIVLLLVALPVVVIGGILAISACQSSDPVPGVSADDDKLIRTHLHEIAPPPAMALRIRDAMQMFRANVVPVNRTPVTITALMVGPGGILISTQSHGIHLYDRETKTWSMLSGDDTSPDTTNDEPSVETETNNTPMAHMIRWSGEHRCSPRNNSIFQSGESRNE